MTTRAHRARLLAVSFLRNTECKAVPIDEAEKVMLSVERLGKRILFHFIHDEPIPKRHRSRRAPARRCLSASSPRSRTCSSVAAGGRGCSMPEAAVILARLGPVPRWYPAHKRVLIELVRAERCDLGVVLAHYEIAPEEYARWVELYQRDGTRGLQAKRRYASGLRVEIPTLVATALPIKGRRRRVLR